jgi:hypothetical protein
MKSQHNYNYNLQLYPTQSNIKLIPISLKFNGAFTIPNTTRFFFDNDIELNNSIITGLSVMSRYNLDNNFESITALTITLKGKNDVVLVESLPLINLRDIKNIGTYNIKNFRTVKRFNLKTVWDKCYIQSNITFSTGVEKFIYLVVFYKPMGTTNL